MNRPHIEELMAFADGELDAKRCREIEALIAADPEPAKQFRVFADTKEPITQLFADRAHEAVPEHLVSLVRNYDQQSRSQRVATATASAASSSLGSFLQRLSDSLSMPSFVMAGVTGAFVVGIAVGTMLSADLITPGRDHLVVSHAPHSTLGVALESNLSGVQMQIALSFRSNDGAYCRKYFVRQTAGNAIEGVACRKKDHGWKDVVRFATKASAVKTATTADPITMEIEKLIAGEFLDRQDEKRLISLGWRQK